MGKDKAEWLTPTNKVFSCSVKRSYVVWWRLVWSPKAISKYAFLC